MCLPIVQGQGGGDICTALADLGMSRTMLNAESHRAQRSLRPVFCGCLGMPRDVLLSRRTWVSGRCCGADLRDLRESEMFCISPSVSTQWV